MDALAPALGGDVVAQTPVRPGDSARWPNLRLAGMLPRAEFDALLAASRLVVAHAGIGTVLSARAHRRPIVLLPRRAALGEHRSDHQMATARRLEGRPGISVAWSEGDLRALVSRAGAPPDPCEPGSLAALRARVSAFIEAG